MTGGARTHKSWKGNLENGVKSCATVSFTIFCCCLQTVVGVLLRVRKQQGKSAKPPLIIAERWTMRSLLLCVHSHTCCGVLVNRVMVRYFDWPGPPLATSSWITGKLADGERGGGGCEGKGEAVEVRTWQGKGESRARICKPFKQPRNRFLA
jgi:hypothetical protein